MEPQHSNKPRQNFFIKNGVILGLLIALIAVIIALIELSKMYEDSRAQNMSQATNSALLQSHNTQQAASISLQMTEVEVEQSKVTSQSKGDSTQVDMIRKTQEILEVTRVAMNATSTALESQLLSMVSINQATIPSPIPTAEPTITPDTASLPPTPIESKEMPPGGKIVFTCQIFRDEDRNQLCIMNADGSGYRRLTTDDNKLHWYGSFSPDGNTIVYSSNQTGNFEIYEMDLNGAATRLTQGLGKLYAPEISPDGNMIVFSNETKVSENESRIEIWVMNRDGSDPRSVYVPNSGFAVDPVWSSDGSQILFAYGEGINDKQLYVIDLDGSELTQVTYLSGIRGRSDWSSDGSLISTYIGEPWKQEIYLLSIDGSDLHQLTYGGPNLAPSFSPDDQWITFTSYRDSNYDKDEDGCEIYIMRVDGSEVTRITSNNYCDYQPRWGP